MINTTGAANWPIVSATYILLPLNPSEAGRALKVMQFYDWAFRQGGQAADQLHYIMLPDAVRTQVRQRWCQVKSNGHPIWTGCH
jgi:phosphate transport system substrate-binding protein